MFETNDNGDVTIFYFQNNRILDEATVQTLGAELLEAAARTKSGKLLLNFRNVELMSSAMIGKLVLLRNRCEEANVSLAFCEISANVMEVFSLMKLDKIVKIFPDEETALGEM